MPSCRHCKPPQPPNWQNDIAMLEQPVAGICDEHVDFKRIDRGSMKPICKATARRFTGLRLRRTSASSTGSGAKKCSISSAESVSGNSSVPR
jgi:hypothetical protein